MGSKFNSLKARIRFILYLIALYRRSTVSAYSRGFLGGQRFFLGPGPLLYPPLLMITICICDASSPHRNLPQGGGHGRVVSRSSCSGTLSQHIPDLSHPLSLSNTLPLHWCSPPYFPSLNCVLIYPFCKVTFIHSHHMSIPSQCVSLDLFNHSTVHSH